MPQGGVDVIGAMVDRMSDQTIATFVAGSVVSERGATGRLAQAFQALFKCVIRVWIHIPVRFIGIYINANTRQTKISAAKAVTAAERQAVLR